MVVTVSVKANLEVQKSYEQHSSAYKGDAGLDLYCKCDIIIPANAHSVCIEFGISIEATENNLPVSMYLYPRSSTGKNTPIRLANSVGIIDSGYRGQIIAYVDNLSNKDFEMKQGERYFQLCGPSLQPIRCVVVNELSKTDRGSSGFGSSNVTKSE
jgi:dUTP pyrophosphatase